MCLTVTWRSYGLKPRSQASYATTTGSQERGHAKNGLSRKKANESKLTPQDPDYECLALVRAGNPVSIGYFNSCLQVQSLVVPGHSTMVNETDSLIYIIDVNHFRITTGLQAQIRPLALRLLGSDSLGSSHRSKCSIHRLALYAIIYTSHFMELSYM